MIAMVVDDERWVLSLLTETIAASPDIEQAYPFQDAQTALDWAYDNCPDIAFLDITLRDEKTGLELAQTLRRELPECRIIFCTAFQDYALQAFALHADGYLIKPITTQRVQEEIDYLLGRSVDQGPPQLQVQCFGNFEVTLKGQVVQFARKKTKEVFALLVDRRGASLTARQICAALWDDDFTADDKNITYLRVLMNDMRKTFHNLNLPDVLVRNGQTYTLNGKFLHCDYYRYLDGEKGVRFLGEYMTQYSWAEETCAALLNNA